MAKNDNNYFQVLGELESYEPQEIGYVVSDAVLQNMIDHYQSYRGRTPKLFRKREENRIFQSLECMANEDCTIKMDVRQLDDIYAYISRKTTNNVKQIDFAYDAINFLLSQREGFDFVFNYVNDRLMTLKKMDYFVKSMPKYKRNDPNIRNHEYNRFLKNFKRSLEHDYSTIFQ